LQTQSGDGWSAAAKTLLNFILHLRPSVLKCCKIVDKGFSVTQSVSEIVWDVVM